MKTTLSMLIVLAGLQANVLAMATIETVLVSDIANDADGGTGFGSVNYSYHIGKYEVTNSQYVAFLNAKAASDPNGLYDSGMAIIQTGSDGEYSYSTTAGNHPVVSVSFWNAIRFANWLHNGQGSGDTENGSYTITQGGIDNNTITRNSGATWAITSENEWYKAAYYDPALSTYYTYGTSTSDVPDYVTPDLGTNSVNYRSAVGGTTDVGAYTNTISPYDLYDMSGNVDEWMETIANSSERIYRGGSFASPASSLLRKTARNSLPTSGHPEVGFRLVLVPEPAESVAMLVLVSLCTVLFRYRR